MPPEFKPSPSSLTSLDKTKAALRYIRKAVDIIEGHIEREGTVLPAWVITRIMAAGRALGVVVSAVNHMNSRSEK